MNFSRLLTLRYLRNRRGFVSVVTGFSLGGITLGVAALIVVMSVMAGFRAELLERILGVTGHATVSAPSTSHAQANALQKTFEAHGEVISAQPFVQGQVMAVAKGRATGALVKGVNPDDTRSNELIASKIIHGNFANLHEPNRVALGKTLAQNLQATVGSTITLLSPEGSQTVVGFIPRMQKFKVAAIFDVGMHMYDSGWIYMSIPSAQKFYKLGDVVTGLDVKVAHPDRIDNFTQTLYEMAERPVFIRTWMDVNKQFFDALQVERVAMFLILALVVVVAAFNIITGQTMMVNDKTADIAILRTMGARRKDILKIFFFNGTLLGTLGTAFGFVLGLLILHYLHPIVGVIEAMFGVSVFSGEAYFLDKLPVNIEVGNLVVIGLVSLGLSMLASLYPAWRAAKLDPVEVLRNA